MLDVTVNRNDTEAEILNQSLKLERRKAHRFRLMENPNSELLGRNLVRYERLTLGLVSQVELRCHDLASEVVYQNQSRRELMNCHDTAGVTIIIETIQNLFVNEGRILCL